MSSPPHTPPRDNGAQYSPSNPFDEDHSSATNMPFAGPFLEKTPPSPEAEDVRRLVPHPPGPRPVAVRRSELEVPEGIVSEMEEGPRVRYVPRRALQRGRANVPTPTAAVPSDYPLDVDTPMPKEGTMTLGELVMRLRFPPSPPYYSMQALSSTRMPKLRPRRPNYHLRDVKHEPNMFRDLRAEVREKLENIIIDFSNPDHRLFVVSIHPHYTTQLLTERIHCERDVEDVIRTVHLKPALAIVRAMQLKGIPTPDQLRTRKKGYFTAPVQERIAGIPDFLLIKGNRKHPKENIRLRGEVKSSHVLGTPDAVYLPVADEVVVEEEEAWDPYTNEDDLGVAESSDDEADIEETAASMSQIQTPIFQPAFSSDDNQELAYEEYNDVSEVLPLDKHIFDGILRLHEDETYAMRFAWPTKQHAKIPISHASAVIMQLWEQLLRGKRDREHRTILSCYSVTTFGARRGTTLYLSDNYAFNSSYLLLDLVCMLSRCLHVTTSRLRLPEVNNTWWSESDVNEAARTTIGIIPETLPPAHD